MSNFHNITTIERDVIYAAVALKTLKLDNLIEDITDKYHDAHIDSYHVDINIPENERKKDYEIGEIFSTRYFLGNSGRSTSNDINENCVIEMIKLVLEELNKKAGMTHSVNMTQIRGSLTISMTLHDVDLSTINFYDDRNYAVNNIIELWTAAPEDERETRFFRSSDEYALVSNVVYFMGNLTVSMALPLSSPIIHIFERFLCALIETKHVKTLIQNKIVVEE